MVSIVRLLNEFFQFYDRSSEVERRLNEIVIGHELSIL